MASFVVKEWQPLPVFNMLINRQCTADLMARKRRIAYYAQWIRVIGFLFFFFFLTGGVATATFCS